MAFQLIAHPRIAKVLAKIPPKIRDTLRKQLDLLAENPEGKFDLKRIQGYSTIPPTLRLRVGSYRILLKVYNTENKILVLRVGPRNTVYKGLQLD